MQEVMNLKGNRESTQRKLSGIIGSLVLLTAIMLLAPVQAESNPAAIINVATIAASEPTHHPRNKTYMKRKWGVEVMYVRTTAAGYMLEFRYKVLDPEKAKQLFERQAKPLLTHAESGAKLIVPTPGKVGPLRNSNPPLANHIYWMFFANPDKLVKPGEHVSVEIGDFVAERLVVQ